MKTKKARFINQIEPWYGKEEKGAILKYLNSNGWLMEFKKTEEFEKSICEYTKAKYCSVLPNGTVTLVLALLALDIKQGDEVIVPDFTMIATPNAVKAVGARPILVDVDENICLDLDLVKKAITKKTKAVIHVSINGRAGNLLGLKKLCEQNKILLIEDAAQSLGSFYNGKHLGNFGAFGSFSFSVPKIITTGQGGALITDKKELYEKIEKLKDFGRIGPGIDQHDQMGWNYKFTDLQAVIGIEQMKKLSWRVKRKKQIFSLYKKLLSGIRQIKFIPTDLKLVSPWFIDILVPDPKELQKHLKENGIGTRIFYPAIHTQPIYKNIKGKFPRAEYFANHGLWLPSSSFLKDSEIKFICKTIKKFYE